MIWLHRLRGHHQSWRGVTAPRHDGGDYVYAFVVTCSCDQTWTRR